MFGFAAAPAAATPAAATPVNGKRKVDEVIVIEDDNSPKRPTKTSNAADKAPDHEYLVAPGSPGFARGIPGDAYGPVDGGNSPCYTPVYPPQDAFSKLNPNSDLISASGTYQTIQMVVDRLEQSSHEQHETAEELDLLDTALHVQKDLNDKLRETLLIKEAASDEQVVALVKEEAASDALRQGLVKEQAISDALRVDLAEQKAASDAALAAKEEARIAIIITLGEEEGIRVREQRAAEAALVKEQAISDALRVALAEQKAASDAALAEQKAASDAALAEQKAASDTAFAEERRANDRAIDAMYARIQLLSANIQI
jgi:hypothetical protein